MTMMRETIFTAAVALALMGCDAKVENATRVDKDAPIYPDYTDVTIPADIAPMNITLSVNEAYDLMDVTVRGSKGGELHEQGQYTDFDIDDWHELTAKNAGGELTFTVCKRDGGQWTQFRDFSMKVSEFPLEDYGLVYRRLAPGYEVGGNIGMFQRDLHTFDEEALMTETALPEQCFNCHQANACNPNRVTLQVRGAKGGTLIMKDGRQQWFNTKTDSTKMAGSYASWHPDGDHIAYTAANVEQAFFVGQEKPIEVYHRFSNIVVLDTRTNEFVTDPKLMTPDWAEIFPAFSADGKTLYYSTSPQVEMPRDYKDVHCSLCSIGFDAATGTFSQQVDTLLSGQRDSTSYVLVRPSYDGRWLVYDKCSRSNFPIQQPDADLWMMNIQTRETWPLTAANSDKSDSYANWSSNSHWIVFESKREDGQYTKLYIAEVGDDGQVAKAFLMPQRDPWNYYQTVMDAYNVPDFTKTKVEFDIIEAREKVLNGTRNSVKVRE